MKRGIELLESEDDGNRALGIAFGAKDPRPPKRPFRVGQLARHLVLVPAEIARNALPQLIEHVQLHSKRNPKSVERFSDKLRDKNLVFFGALVRALRLVVVAFLMRAVLQGVESVVGGLRRAGRRAVWF